MEKEDQNIAARMDVLVGDMVDLVADMRSYLSQIEYAHEEINEEYGNCDFGIKINKKREAVYRIIPNGKIAKFYEIGDIARQLCGYIQRTGDVVIKAKVCSIDLCAMAEFYNFMIGYYSNPDDPEYSFRGVITALNAVQDIKGGSYVQQPIVEVQKAVTTSPYSDLTSFISGGTGNIEYMMKYKQPQNNVKLLWGSDKGDVLLFHDILGWTIPEINRCIRFKGGKPVSLSNRKQNGESPLLCNILKDMK